jgi:hypothetical protein
VHERNENCEENSVSATWKRGDKKQSPTIGKHGDAQPRCRDRNENFEIGSANEERRRREVSVEWDEKERYFVSCTHFESNVAKTPPAIPQPP